jgi:hypothetical protein
MIRPDLQAEFQKFDEENPRIWELIVMFCERVIESGKRKWAMSNIFEMIRWEIYIVTRSEEEWKLNNNHRAYYARKWLKLHPEYPGFFETRAVRGEPPKTQFRFDEDGQGNFFL